MNRSMLAIALSFSFSCATLAGCTSDADPGSNEPRGTPASEPAQERVALIQGTLRDPATAGATHDRLATQTRERAQGLGDIGHYTSVSLEDPARSLTIDRWKTLDGAKSLYGDPGFQAAVAQLFVGTPSVALHTIPAGWVSWGDIDYRKLGAKIFAVTIHGRLGSSDVAVSKKAHDDAAGALQPVAQARGDVAHVVLQSIEDPRDVTFIDYWTDPEAIAPFYESNEARQAFGRVFEGRPAFAIFETTAWVQW